MHVRSVLGQVLEALERVVAHCCDDERREFERVASVHIGAGFDAETNKVDVTAAARLHERRPLQTEQERNVSQL